MEVLLRKSIRIATYLFIALAAGVSTFFIGKAGNGDTSVSVIVPHGNTAYADAPTYGDSSGGGFGDGEDGSGAGGADDDGGDDDDG